MKAATLLQSDAKDDRRNAQSIREVWGWGQDFSVMMSSTMLQLLSALFNILNSPKKVTYISFLFMILFSHLFGIWQNTVMLVTIK